MRTFEAIRAQGSRAPRSTPANQAAFYPFAYKTCLAKEVILALTFVSDLRMSAK